MLSPGTIYTIRAQTQEYWISELGKPQIRSIAEGKEIGHKLADLVDEKTTALLTVNHLTKRECDASGGVRARSMGDIWLLEDGVYHPVNVKTGVVGAEGQPNLVSLKKVLRAIMNRQIDSYYLLVVKLRISSSAIDPSVYFIDMLDWLEYVTFDSGPGQMMLKAARFFAEYGTKEILPIPIHAKVERLMGLYEDGERRLKENRERDLSLFRRTYAAFIADESFEVTPDTQRSLKLV